MLFFGSLVFAGLTSLISVLEVVIAAVQDKWKLARVPATLAVGLPLMVVSTVLFGTTTGLPVLDTMDKFVNTYGIVAAGMTYVAAIVISKNLPKLREHLNSRSSFKVGTVWYACVVLTVAVLGYMLFQDTSELLAKNYEGYPSEFLNIFGWGMSIGMVVLAVVLSLLPWKNEAPFDEFNEKD